MKRISEKTLKVFSLKDMETLVSSQNRKKRVESAVLGVIAFAGVLTASAVAPNALRILTKVMPDLRPLSQKQSIRRTISRLITQGHIEKRKDGNGYVLSNTGKTRLAGLQASTRSVGGVAKRWDGKWRVVIFDIKESKREVRDQLRTLLVNTGFVRLQNSVWVFPYQCDEVVSLIKIYLKLGYSCIYIIADAIEGDEYFREYYGLPKQKDR